MKPQQENPKPAKPRTEEKPKRFRIVKLEPRIAPSFQWGVCNGMSPEGVGPTIRRSASPCRSWRTCCDYFKRSQGRERVTGAVVQPHRRRVTVPGVRRVQADPIAAARTLQ